MMSRELERRLSEAVEIAKQGRHEFVTLEHILLALLKSPLVVQIIEGCGANVQKLKPQLRDLIKKHCPQISTEQIGNYGGMDSWQPEFTLACHRLFQRAALQVQSAGKKQVDEGHLLVALFYEQDSHSVFCLSQQGISQFDVINYVSHDLEKDALQGQAPALSGPKVDVDGQAQDESKNSTLDTFCTNLNEKAKLGNTDPLIGREDVIERTLQILCRRTKNNPLLIGEPGVGKTAIAEGLAAKIVAGLVPEALRDKVIFSLDMGTLLAGTKFRGDFEGRLKSVLKDIKKRNNAILFIDEIHTIVGAGATSDGSMDASNLLKPSLANGEISCIGSTTHQEYRQHFEKDRALNRRFQKIDIKEPSQDECFEILKGLKKKFEEHHQVQYSEGALRAAVELSSKYIHSKLLPDKAIDVVDEAGAKARMNGKTNLLIETREIEEVIAQIAQVPAASVSANDKEQLREIDKKLKAVIYGQDEAIDRLSSAIKYARSGLGRDNKPIASFLFTGPTGVGKTEVCKQLAQILGIPLVRFDMSEYMEKATASRLTGAPPGYVGYEEGGQLTEAVTKSPYCVLLLDEIEKAHQDIFNVLLQVMDAGRLTDSQGRTADFRNVLLVMTSNAGALEVSRGAMGFVEQPARLQSLEALKKTFAPEFLNRLDAVVSFRDLDESIVIKVAAKFVEELQMQLQKKMVHLQLNEDALKWLMKKGYDKVYGARPMARTVDEHLKKALVDELLFGKLANGGKVLVSLKNEALDFLITPASP